MDSRNDVAGLVTIGASLLGGGYLLRAVSHALTSGISPGKLGAVHYAGESQYYVFVGGCLVGLALFGGLFALGLRWMGMFRAASS